MPSLHLSVHDVARVHEDAIRSVQLVSGHSRALERPEQDGAGLVGGDPLLEAGQRLPRRLPAGTTYPTSSRWPATSVEETPGAGLQLSKCLACCFLQVRYNIC